MATDATGAPTPLGIPKYNTSADAPSGLGFNAAMDAIDALIAAKVSKPASIASGEVPVWNGSTWVRSSATNIGPTSLGSGTPDATKFLRGDGAWATASSPDGWTSLSTAMTYGSTDGHTFTMTYSGDLTSSFGPGARIRLTNQGGTQYFIVTAHVAGTITLYGGSAPWSITNTPITNVWYSRERYPVGFSTNPAAWTEEFRDVTDVSQATPGNQWYNIVGSLAVPIGAWDLGYHVEIDVAGVSQTNTQAVVQGKATLWTVPAAEGDLDFTSMHQIFMYTNGSPGTYNSFHRRKNVLLAAKTTYYLNVRGTGGAGVSTLVVRGTSGSTIIRATSAYL